MWLVGLGVWFSLRVREVPGSNPGRALLFRQKKNALGSASNVPCLVSCCHKSLQYHRSTNKYSVMKYYRYMYNLQQSTDNNSRDKWAELRGQCHKIWVLLEAENNYNYRGWVGTVRCANIVCNIVAFDSKHKLLRSVTAALLCKAMFAIILNSSGNDLLSFETLHPFCLVYLSYYEFRLALRKVAAFGGKEYLP
jgi:hypothetical protein